jgi:hypothetical protein
MASAFRGWSMGTLRFRSSIHTELWMAHTDLSLSGAVHTAMPLASALTEAGPWAPCNSKAAYTQNCGWHTQICRCPVQYTQQCRWPVHYQRLVHGYPATQKQRTRQCQCVSNTLACLVGLRQVLKVIHLFQLKPYWHPKVLKVIHLLVLARKPISS